MMDNAPLLDDGDFEAQMLRLARSGDRDAAVDAMRSAMCCLYAGRISSDLSFYIAQALQAALDADDGPTGKTLERAFFLSRKRGERGSEQTANRQALIAAWVHLTIARGWPASVAKAQASDLWGVENIDRALRSVDEVAAREAPGDDAWERAFVSMGKPLPPRQ